MNTIKTFCCLLLGLFLSSWGFYAHKSINRQAVYSLPTEMAGFYLKHQDQLVKRATLADQRKFSDKEEACRHYLDIDYYGEEPFSIFPLRWDSAVIRFTEDTLKAYGIVPWQVQWSTYSLQKAFENHEWEQVIHISADLGHYMADACVPLHSTLNYNGQLSGQKGIHSLWESAIPEEFAEHWNFMVGRADYIDRVDNYVWGLFAESFALKDSVLLLEKQTRQRFDERDIYVYSQRKQQYTKRYTKEFLFAYDKALNGMVERRMRKSIKAVADLWYTSWVNAGQPDL